MGRYTSAFQAIEAEAN
jgi:hypothetical protein